jgi:hypothetical protein
MLGSTLQDVRYGIRQLRQSPGFTIVAVLSLALGIGANTAIFELVNAIRLKMLPVQNPRELVAIDFQKKSMRAGWFSSRSAHLTFDQWERIRAEQQAFSGVLAWSAARLNLADAGEVRWAEGLYVSGDSFAISAANALLAAHTTFRRLDGDVPEKELNLLQFGRAGRIGRAGHTSGENRVSQPVTAGKAGGLGLRLVSQVSQPS